MGFIKNDKSFICINCNKKIEKLKYTSRDHCNYCLYSIHIDIQPGDRLNECKGILIPINCFTTSKKGMVIEYKCSKCKKIVRNIAAKDDNKDIIFKTIENYSKASL